MGLSAEETLRLFGGYYQAVLNDPDGTSHTNIRQFMKTGWDGLKFPKGTGLKERKTPIFSTPKEKEKKKKNK